MGTRNLTIIQLDGKYPVAQYGQWDGYPDGKGIGILKFLRTYGVDLEQRIAFKEKVAAIRVLDKDERMRLFKECGGSDQEDAPQNRAANAEWLRRYPWWSRDVSGAPFLEMLAAGNVPFVDNDIDFIADSLMCEWAWVIDLDRNTFEAFKGFNHAPLTETDRFFAWEEKSHIPRRGEDQYHPCKLAASWSLDDLPGDDAFLDSLKEKEMAETS